MEQELTGAARSDALMAEMHKESVLIWDDRWKIWVWVPKDSGRV